MRDDAKRDFARHLRSEMTDAEQRLWKFLRRRQMLGFRFRRQHPIGPYIADFACVERRFIVEIDGGQHTSLVDARRSNWFRTHGWGLLRFWNNDVLSRTNQVLEEIGRALDLTYPHPDLPPQAGEGEEHDGVSAEAMEGEAQEDRTVQSGKESRPATRTGSLSP